MNLTDEVTKTLPSEPVVEPINKLSQTTKRNVVDMLAFQCCWSQLGEGEPYPLTEEDKVQFIVSLLERLLIKLMQHRENSKAVHLKSATCNDSDNNATSGTTFTPKHLSHQKNKEKNRNLTNFCVGINRFNLLGLTCNGRSSKRGCSSEREDEDPPPTTTPLIGSTSNNHIVPNIRNQLQQYVIKIHSMYNDVKYHNFHHAFHVTLSANKLIDLIASRAENNITSSRVEDDFAFGLSSDPLMHFAIVFAALTHDVGHKGLPNAQLAKIAKKLAIKYNFQSVAENHSIDLALSVLSESTFKDLRESIFVTLSERERFLEIMVDAIMCTDIFCPKQIGIGRKKWDVTFSSDHVISSQSENILYRRPQSITLPLTGSSVEIDSGTKNNGEEYYCLSKGTEARETLRANVVMELLIQACDVAHTMQNWSVFLKWNRKLYEELTWAFNKKCGNDPLPGWYSAQLSFFDNYVIPLASKLHTCGVFESGGDFLLQQALKNKERWANEGEIITRKMVVELQSSCDSRFFEESRSKLSPKINRAA